MRGLLMALLASACAGSYTSANKRYSCATARADDEIVFDCGGEFISMVNFASYGAPNGRCDGTDGSMLRRAGCHAARSEAVLEERCLGQTTCMFVVSDELFGKDPCPGRAKQLAAWLSCGDHVAADLAARDAAQRAAARRTLSTGWRTVIAILLLFSAYCGIGIFFNVRRLGMPLGLSAIPHADTWRALPFLVRDGFVFTIDTLKSKARGNYDSVL